MTYDTTESVDDIAAEPDPLDEPLAEAEDAPPDDDPQGADLGADFRERFPEIAALSDEHGMTAWRAERREREAEEAAEREANQELLQNVLEDHGQIVQEREYELERAARYGALDEALETLNLAVEADDPAAVWNAADQLKTAAPEALPDFYSAWCDQDPLAARQWAAMYKYELEGQGLAVQQQAQWNQQQEAADAHYAYQQAFQEQAQKGMQAAAESVQKKFEKLSATDPAFESLRPTMVDYMLKVFTDIQNVGLNTALGMVPQVADDVLVEAYESALALHDARRRAKNQLDIDEMLRRQDIASGKADRPWNRDEALERLTQEQLQKGKAPRGVRAEARRRSLAGDRGGIAAAQHTVDAVDELVAHDQENLQRQSEMTRSYVEAKEKREKERRLGRDPLPRDDSVGDLVRSFAGEVA